MQPTISPAMAGRRNSSRNSSEPKRSQGRGAHVGLHADGHRDAAAGDAAEFLGGDDRVAVVQAHAAELLRRRCPAAEFAGLAEDLVDREAAVLFPLVDVGVDFPLDEAANGAAEFLVFLVKIMGCLSSWASLFSGRIRLLSQPSSFRRAGKGCRRLACFSQNLATPKLLPFSGRALGFRADIQQVAEQPAAVARVDRAVVPQLAVP